MPGTWSRSSQVRSCQVGDCEDDRRVDYRASSSWGGDPIDVSLSGQVQDLWRQLYTRMDDVNIVHGYLMLSDAARVRAERERESLTEEVAKLSMEKAKAVHLHLICRTTSILGSRTLDVLQWWNVGKLPWPIMSLKGLLSPGLTLYYRCSTELSLLVVEMNRCQLWVAV